ncbi:MAG: hypothetical protein U5O15_07715 [Candidatus Krumholzibacteriota bacterium]|nr:hypothetical protein [Candidatus Krumholzibacteriota bacterium]
MKTVFNLIVFSLLLSVSVSAFAQEPLLRGSMEAHKIVADKRKDETAVPADKVVPDDVVEYTLRYRNEGKNSASGVELIGPVPPGTAYIDDSISSSRVFTALLSIDGGKSYHQPPVTFTVVNEDGKEEKREATPEMVTHLKWKMNEDLEASGIVTASYRVLVE